MDDLRHLPTLSGNRLWICDAPRPLLEKPIRLPLLNVDLPLVGFFAVAPTVLLIFHFYVFLQLGGLANKARDYNTLLAVDAPVASDRRYIRQRLDAFPILQFLAGPKDQRTDYAEEEGLTRSAFLAAAARHELARARPAYKSGHAKRAAKAAKTRTKR
jgi:hypothetical protein